jgi:hypothetical protein
MRCHFNYFFGLHHGGRGLGRFGKGFMSGGSSGSHAFGNGRKSVSDLQLPALGQRAEPAGAQSAAEPEHRSSPELGRAMHALQLALLDVWIGSREEEQRVAAVLKRATAEILGSAD